ncbi:MAG: hypothetical protein LBU98_03645 [Alistipes sp.]|jgi:hypothetical protein|nr:hypothetical protein [Alistipes sp.]
MKRQFAYLALCLLLVACKIENRPPLRLEQSQVTAYLNYEGKSVEVSGGSGEYMAAVSDPAVASVSLGTAGYGGLNQPQTTCLVIEPKALGTAVIAVTDKRSGGVALLGLTVEERIGMLRVTKVLTNVDADNNVDEIGEAVAADGLLKMGYAIDYEPSGSQVEHWTQHDFRFSNAEGEVTVRGKFTISEDIGELNPAFLPLLPNNIQYRNDLRKWEFTRDNGETWWYGYIVDEDNSTRTSPVLRDKFYFWEDLTERYKAMYPDAGIRGVARVVVARH